MFSYTASTPLICNLYKINERIAWKFLSSMQPSNLRAIAQCDISHLSSFAHHVDSLLPTSSTSNISLLTRHISVFINLSYQSTFKPCSSDFANNHFNVISWKTPLCSHFLVFSPCIILWFFHPMLKTHKVSFHKSILPWTVGGH